jgi:putative ABC transport system permease protein
MGVDLPESKYSEESDQIAFFKQALERIRNLPGADSVGAVSDLPLSGAEEIDAFTIEGRPTESLSDMPLADFRYTDHNYFNTMRIPLIAGRYLTQQDNETAQGALVISQALARRFYPNEDPVGKRIKPGGENSGTPWRIIVGVVGDVKHSGLDKEARPQLYLPYLQGPEGRMTFVVRTTSDPTGLIGAMRNEIWAIDKNQPINNVKTLEEYASASVSKDRFNLTLLAVFAAVALILAAVGIYGVMSYSVAQRTREIGIRMALGARASDVLKLIVRQGVVLTLVGVAAGIGGALLLTRFMSSLLVGVSATDPVTFTVIPLIMIVAALAACLVPARRATRVDPMVALRYE